MLRSLKGIWRWQRKAEGGHPLSDPLPLQPFVLISNNLLIPTIELVEFGRFLFWIRSRRVDTQLSWQSLAVFYLVLAV